MDETVRILRGAGRPPPSGGRRWALGILGGGAALLTLGAAAVFLWPESPPPPQRLGPRQLVPPLLRAPVGASDLLFVLTQRSEQDAADPPGAVAPRTRFELLAFGAADLAPRFAVHLASVPRGNLADAGLIAAQGATIWLWLGGLGAVSGVDGRLLADSEGLAGINPEIAAGLGPVRRSIRLGDALVVEAGGAWRIDPRDFKASRADLPPPRPLPMIQPAALFGNGGPAAFRVAEARVEGAWFGLPPEEMKLVAPMAPRAGGRFLDLAALAAGPRQALWRGAVRVGALAPANAPPNQQQRWGVGERVMDLTTVPEVAGLRLAGFLTAGTEAPLLMAGPSGLLILHGGVERRLSLVRLGPEGEVAWQAELPISRLRSVLPGARHLLLAGWDGPKADAAELLVSIALETGAVTARAVTA